ncbi:hypothetical protein OEZ86_014292 [Tetradesmus obliquus]|nr:hypothetical protein OEZ86_014292 [Tetradesmus obliquus]
MRRTWTKIRLAAALWQQGLWEALQLQRCVVFFVLDSSGRVLSQTTKCFVVNGLIYLGSIALNHYCTTRAVTWLLQAYAQPVYGAAAVAAWQQLLGLLFQLLWLMPLYGISIMVSCIWYQQVAAAAYDVICQQQQQQQQQAPQTGQPDGLQHQQQQQQQQGRPSIHPALVLEGTAQEVFRVLLFLVFTLEVFVISLLPFVGPVLNVLLLSWLYAYYCFDYKWALQGARLPQRLAFFEAHWAFFAGFGFPCVAATAFFPMHIGAALANLLFPAFILVAAGADPLAAQRRVVAPEGSSLRSIPIFKLALRPTYWIIRRLFGGRSSRVHAA